MGALNSIMDIRKSKFSSAFVPRQSVLTNVVNFCKNGVILLMCVLSDIIS